MGHSFHAVSVEAGTLRVASSLTVWDTHIEVSRVAKFIGSAMPPKTDPQLTILRLAGVMVTSERPEL